MIAGRRTASFRSISSLNNFTFPLPICRGSSTVSYTHLDVYKRQHIQTVTHELLPAAEVTVLPISDGGEGLVEAVVKNGGFLRQEGMFCDPQRQPWSAVWARRGSEAVIELAQCSGLGLCQPRNPALASTYGTGLQIKAALNSGCKTIYLGPVSYTHLYVAVLFTLADRFHRK